MDTNYQPYRTPIWRLALGGVIAGAALYFFPFLFPMLGFFLLAGLFFRIIWGGRRQHMRMAWAQMSDEQRAQFGGRCGSRHRGTWQQTKPETQPQP